MAFTDRTSQFREIVAKSSLPGAKRRKITKRSHDETDDAQALLNKEYLREAYNIVRREHCLVSDLNLPPIPTA